MQLQSEALMAAAGESVNDYDFALVAMGRHAATHRLRQLAGQGRPGRGSTSPDFGPGAADFCGYIFGRGLNTVNACPR